jgi:hypothetical protein
MTSARERWAHAAERHARRRMAEPELAVKRPVPRSMIQRFHDACDGAYLLERGGLDVELPWKIACLGNGLNREE